MRSHELTLGRSFAVAFDDGEDFFTALAEFCQHHNVRQGYIPGFIAGFSEVGSSAPATSSTTPTRRCGPRST